MNDCENCERLHNALILIAAGEPPTETAGKALAGCSLPSATDEQKLQANLPWAKATKERGRKIVTFCKEIRR